MNIGDDGFERGVQTGGVATQRERPLGYPIRRVPRNSFPLKP